MYFDRNLLETNPEALEWDEGDDATLAEVAKAVEQARDLETAELRANFDALVQDQKGSDARQSRTRDSASGKQNEDVSRIRTGQASGSDVPVNRGDPKSGTKLSGSDSKPYVEDVRAIVSRLARENPDVDFLRRMSSSRDALELLVKQLEVYADDVLAMPPVIVPAEDTPTMDALMRMVEDVPGQSFSTFTMEELKGMDIFYDPGAEDLTGRTLKQLFEQVNALGEEVNGAESAGSEKANSTRESGGSTENVPLTRSSGDEKDGGWVYNYNGDVVGQDPAMLLVERYMEAYSSAINRDVEAVRQSLMDFVQSEPFTEVSRAVLSQRERSSLFSQGEKDSQSQTSDARGSMGSAVSTQSEGDARQRPDGEEEASSDEETFVLVDKEMLGVPDLGGDEKFMVDKGMWEMMLKNPGATLSCNTCLM